MERISELEKKYVLEVLSNEFDASKNSVFNSRLEKSFAETFGVNYAIAHTNGTSSMHAALMALGVGEGDEVIVPPLTMSSTSIVVLQCKAIPVFADVDPETFTLDPASVEACITSKTKAMIPVSLYGLAPDYDGLLAVCRKHNIRMLEDNAECFLGEYKGKLVGQFGDFASFSFQASKHMTCGDGGMLVTNDQDQAIKARQYAVLGYSTIGATKGKIDKNDIQDPRFNRHVLLGFNYRMSELNAAVALGQLERLQELVANRIAVADLFAEALQGSDLLIPQRVPAGYKHTYWTYPAYLKTDAPEKEWYEFRKLFQQNGGDGYYAAWRLGYQEPLMQNFVAGGSGVWQSFAPGLCPTAEYLQARMLQFKTNYWNLDEAKIQAGILHKTVKEFNG